MKWLTNRANKRYLPEELLVYADKLQISTKRLEYYLQLQRRLDIPFHHWLLQALPVAEGIGTVDDTAHFLRLCPPDGNCLISRAKLYKLYALWSYAPIKRELFYLLFKAPLYGCPKESAIIRLFDNRMKNVNWKQKARRKEIAGILNGKKKITPRPFG